MTDSTAQVSEMPAKRAIWPWILGVFLACLGGAGGYFAVRAGILPIGEARESTPGIAVVSLPNVAFVPIDPIVVSLPDDRVLRFRAELEVGAPHAADVQKMLPRVVDVMNSYLRALEPADFQHPAALPRVRSQLLRRLQIVVGDGRVRDLLIMEFVLS